MLTGRKRRGGEGVKEEASLRISFIMSQDFMGLREKTWASHITKHFKGSVLVLAVRRLVGVPACPWRALA